MATPAGDKHPPVLLRDDSWLAFNARVLEEAMDPAVPLLEQAKFLSIFSSNLDEFFMVRIAGLARHAPDAVVDFGGRFSFSPNELRMRLLKRIHRLTARQYSYWNNDLKPALAAQGIRVVSWQELPPELAANAADAFNRELKSVPTPLAIPPDEPLPLLPNRALELLFRVRCPGSNEIRTAFMQAPILHGRFLKFDDPGSPGAVLLLPLEDLIAANAEVFFPGCEVLECAPFRITRDRDLTLDEESLSDLVTEMQMILQKRGKRTIVRLEISGGMSSEAQAFLMKRIPVSRDELFIWRGLPDLKSLMELTDLPGHPGLLDPPLPPLPSIHCPPDRSMFDAIRTGGPFFLHVPYESFDPVVRLLTEAAGDPEVAAIKQTLYRVGQDPPVVHELIRAARSGKQVTVLFEIMARFDEENNIRLSRELADAGAHVLYGVRQIKIHAKMLLIVRREQDGVRRYLHLPTGNYNCATARQYTDIGLFTCDDALADDVSALFNSITGFAAPSVWNKLIAAPYCLRERILALIDREAALSSPEQPGSITMKMNALLDSEVIDHLCAAAAKGVRIDLIVRGICTLNPHALERDAASNIRIVSILDRFLEHSRIFRFGGGGTPSYYIGSADLMPRNLNRRVEILVPIEQSRLTDELDVILHTLLHDRRKGRRLLGENRYSHTAGTHRYEAERSQIFLYNYYQQRYKRSSGDAFAQPRESGAKLTL